jgi:hypothetical protein
MMMQSQNVQTTSLPNGIQHARCPRCGYDQRGVVAAWVESCPLRGTCSECGTPVDWARVLQPEKYEPDWCIEFAPRRRLLQSCFETFIRSFRPWRFWPRLQMDFSMRWRRLIIYLSVLALPLFGTYIGLQAAVAIHVRMLFASEMQAWQAKLPPLVKLMQREWIISKVIPQSPLGLSRYDDNAYAMSIAELNDTIQHPLTIKFSYTGAAIEAILFPLADSSAGRVTGSWQYPAPSELWECASAGSVLYAGSGTRPATVWSNVRDVIQSPVMPIVLVVPCLFAMIFPCSILLLPVTRKRAKVRWQHIMRIALYGWFAVFFSVYAALLIGIVDVTLRTSGVEFGYEIIPIMVLPPIMLTTWWAVAIKRYLYMPRAAAIAILLAILNLLLVWTILAALFG